MRVLMTTDAVGGVWTYAVELAAELAERGAAVTLAVLGPAPSEAQRAMWEPRYEHHGRLEWQDDPWDDVRRSGEWLLELAGDLRPDVVHLNGYAHGALEWPAPVLVVGHSCVLSWWEAVRGEPTPARLGRYRNAVRDGLLGADCVIAPTQAMLGELRRLYGIGSGAGHVIPNGLRDRFDATPVKQPFVLGAGRLWDEAKGLATLDEAAGRIEWPVEVAGDGGTSRGAARLLGRLERDAMRARLEAAAIFAHPARYEPFGLAPLEAGLAGCALVLGDLPSLREVWGEAADYVPPGDAEALARALRRLIGHEERREEMAGRARRRARLYRIDRTADAYVADYTRLMARSEWAAA